MASKLTNLNQMRMTAMEAKGFSAQVAAAAAAAIEEIETAKQDKLSGKAGQFVGFGAEGSVTVLPAPVRGVTRAEYDALPVEEQNQSLFIITDSDSGGGEAATKEYVDGLVGDIGSLLDTINGEVV